MQAMWIAWIADVKSSSVAVNSSKLLVDNVINVAFLGFLVHSTIYIYIILCYKTLYTLILESKLHHMTYHKTSNHAPPHSNTGCIAVLPVIYICTYRLLSLHVSNSPAQTHTHTE